MQYTYIGSRELITGALYALKLTGFSVVLALVLHATPMVAQVAPSLNELTPNGSFEQSDPNGDPVVWGKMASFVRLDGRRALRMQSGQAARLDWSPVNRVLWNAEYTLRWRVKADVHAAADVDGMRLSLWAVRPGSRLALGNPFFTPVWNGAFDWEQREFRFRMPEGATAFILLPEPTVGSAVGVSYITDLSLRPSDDRPLPIDTEAATYGAASPEQIAWIWTRQGFPWHNRDMDRDVATPVAREEPLFRRTIECPAHFTDPQAVFTGDDSAQLFVNGRLIGSNGGTVRNIVRIPLGGVLQGGRNDILFHCVNSAGPAGLCGWIEWKTPNGDRTITATNERWECSIDEGKTWAPAHRIAVPVPASTDYRWLYPHLPYERFTLTYALPQGIESARIAIHATGSFRLLADGADIAHGIAAGSVVRLDLGDKLNGARGFSVAFEDIAQPPAGQASLELRIGGAYQTVTLDQFLADDGKSPVPVHPLYPGKTWPLNIGSFEAAASRPSPSLSSQREPWAASLLRGVQPIFTVGRHDDSSAEFAPLEEAGNQEITIPVRDPSTVPRGLELHLRPAISMLFSLPAVPTHGAALVIDVADADVLTPQLAVFTNGVLCGIAQLIGYDQFPGGRLTNRAWVVTIPKERLHAGKNRIVLRLVPPFYPSADSAAMNLASDTVRNLDLGDRRINRYTTGSWLHWDCITLDALARQPSDPVDGRPVWMGVGVGDLPARGLTAWNDYVFRDLEWLGLQDTEAPIGVDLRDPARFAAMDRPDPALAADQTVGAAILGGLKARGLRSLLQCEPGRGIIKPDDDLTDTNEGQILARYGHYFSFMEVGGDLDNPNYGWDALSLAAAYVDIQKEAVVGQKLKALSANKSLQLVGSGWYGGWDNSVMDAQQRKETPDDPAWTENLGAHDSGKSYIAPAVLYYLLYGVTMPKPVWITDCGAAAANDSDVADFDLNLRGNIAFATYIEQSPSHPYTVETRKTSLFSSQNATATPLERARDFRRLLHAYGLHGKPLPWRYADAAAMRDRLVLINPVETAKSYKISFINFSHDQQPLDLTVSLPTEGAVEATRYADGNSVEAGSRAVILPGGLDLRFRETLAPGETVEYYISKRLTPPK